MRQLAETSSLNPQIKSTEHVTNVVSISRVPQIIVKRIRGVSRHNEIQCLFILLLQSQYFKSTFGNTKSTHYGQKSYFKK